MPSAPSSVREEAQRGLDWREQYNRGGTPVGWARARDLSNGVDISLSTLRRMVSFFARHEVDKQGRGYRVGSDGYPSAGRIAWALWGGDAGRTWAESQVSRMEKAMSEASSSQRKPGRLRSLRITRVDRVAAGANPDAHVVLYKREELDDNATPSDIDGVGSQDTDLSADARLTETEHTMTEVDRESLAPEIAALLTETESERDAALAKNAELEATIAETVIVDEPAVEVEDEDEEVLKALDPTVRSRIEKAETERNVLAERVAKMEDEALTREFVAKATEFNAVDADADSLGALLKDVAKNCDIETVQTLERLLKSTAAKITESQRLILAEIGTAAGLDLTDAGQRIESLAKARAEQTGEAMPVATAAILNDNPHLYEQARAERI